MLAVIRLNFLTFIAILLGLSAALTCFCYMNKLVADKKKAGELTSVNYVVFSFISNLSLMTFFFGLLLTLGWLNSF